MEGIRTIDVVVADRGMIDGWMALVMKVRHVFPGFETEADLARYRFELERRMDRGEAICALDGERVAGFLMFSRELNMLCHTAVDPDYRRMGIASRMLGMMIERLDGLRDISVVTFREGDPKGAAPRALYKSFGFVEDVLCAKHGYGEQRFVLPAKNNSGR